MEAPSEHVKHVTLKALFATPQHTRRDERVQNVDLAIATAKVAEEEAEDVAIRNFSRVSALQVATAGVHSSRSEVTLSQNLKRRVFSFSNPLLPKQAQVHGKLQIESESFGDRLSNKKPKSRNSADRHHISELLAWEEGRWVRGLSAEQAQRSNAEQPSSTFVGGPQILPKLSCLGDQGAKAFRRKRSSPPARPPASGSLIPQFADSTTPSPPPAAMKFTLALAAAAVATVAAYDHTTTCPFTSFTKLAPVATEPSLQVCQDASGWQMLPPVGMPTADQYTLMCATPECFTLITAVNATKPDDCMLVFGDVSLNVKELVDTFEPICFA